jgi:hypothetical protein
MGKHRYHYLALEESLCARDAILDLVKDAPGEFEETRGGDVLVLKTRLGPEMYDALRNRGCKVTTDEGDQTVIVIPDKPRREERVLQVWLYLIIFNGFLLLPALVYYIFIVWQNGSLGI